MTDHKPGDEIEITYRTTVRPDGHYRGHFLHSGPEADSVKITVIKRADDPSKDPVGTIRENTGTYGGTYAFLPENSSGDPVWRHTVVGFEVDSDDSTLGPIVGAIPGTPAAGQVPDEVLREVKRLMGAQKKIQAIKYLREHVRTDHPLYSLKAAKEFVESLPEHKTWDPFA